MGLRADLVVLDEHPFEFEEFGSRVVRVFQAGAQKFVHSALA